jgi:hypothetical protein
MLLASLTTIAVIHASTLLNKNMTLKHVERLLNSKILAFQSDWGGEHRRLSQYFEREGIQHRVSCPHTS